MIIRQNRRPKDGWKHGLAAAVNRQDYEARADGALSARSRPERRRMVSADRLLASFLAVRRTLEVKVRLIDEAQEEAIAEIDDAHSYLRAYGSVLPTLIKVDRYERRAESQFQSASYEYLRAESETQRSRPC